MNLEEKLGLNVPAFEISQIFKKEIKNYFLECEKIFFETSGHSFLHKHIQKVDSIISLAYKATLREFFDIYMPLNTPIVLVALGSYGREELSLHSDIDIMIVYKETRGYNTKEIVEYLFYLLIDSGLKISHRVHNVEELFDVSNSDITIKTALLESRYICGSKTLWFEVEKSLIKIRKFNSKDFILAKLKEYENRINKNDFTLQFDIKEGIGGLRDANTLSWIVNIAFGVKKIKELQDILFSSEEYSEFRISFDFLFKIRNILHIITKKDKVLLENIPQISEKLKLPNSPKGHSECLSSILRHSQALHFFCHKYITLISRKYIYESKNISILKKARIAKGIFLYQNKVYFSKKSGGVEDILSLGDIDFEFDITVAIKIKKLTPKQSLQFLKLLFSKLFIANFMKVLFEANLIDKFIPQFRKILNLPQFDGFHVHSVDRHTLNALHLVEHLPNGFLNDLYLGLTINDRTILKISILFHDIGKGRMKDHSIVGENLIRGFLSKLDFSDEDIKVGSLLVRHHTMMANVAQKEDIYSEVVLLSFVSKIESLRVLRLLYLLSFVDVSCVNKTIMSKILEKIFYDLYISATFAFEKKELIYEVHRRIKKEEQLKKYPPFLDLPKKLQKDILSIKSHMFFIKLTLDEILDISAKVTQTKSFSYKIKNQNFLQIIRKIPLNLGFLLGKLSYLNIVWMDIFKLFDNAKYFSVCFAEEEIDDLSFLIEESFCMDKKINLQKPSILKKEITLNTLYSKELAEFIINTKDQKGLLAYIATVFDKFGIDIVSAKIYTQKNRAKDIFLIEKNDGFKNIDLVIKNLISNSDIILNI